MPDTHVNRRKFFMHSAHTTIGVSAGLAAFQSCDLSSFAAETSIRQPLHLCLVSGSVLYKSDEALATLQKHVADFDDVRCSRAFRQAKDDLPGLEALEQADCMLLFTRRMTIDGQQLECIKRYCRRGGGIVGVRTASHGLENWPTFDRDVLGGDYQGHYRNASTQVRIVEAAKDHPVLAGVGPFCSRGTLYKNPNIASDTTVLLTGSAEGHVHPVAWTRPYLGGRVFYTSLGHADDFRQADFLRLLVNAIYWTARREPRSQ